MQYYSYASTWEDAESTSLNHGITHADSPAEATTIAIQLGQLANLGKSLVNISVIPILVTLGLSHSG